jgi:hypothetical protein
LGWIGQQRTGVRHVLHAIAVNVVITGVADAVHVQISLPLVLGQRTVVGIVKDAIVIVIIFAGIADSIPIRIALPGIGHQGTIVHGIHVPVVIIVDIGTVVGSIPIRVGPRVIDNAVAIVVQTVTELCGPRIDGRHQRLAILLVLHTVAIIVSITGIPGPIAIKVFLQKVGYQRTVVLLIDNAVAVIVQVLAIAQAVEVAIGEPLISLFVAVIIEAIAKLLCTGINARIERGTVFAIKDTVIVIVGITGIAEAVVVRVDLKWVHHQRTVVKLVGNLVIVIIGVNAVSHCIGVGIREDLVNRTVTVVVQAIAQLLLRFGQRWGLAIHALTVCSTDIDPRHRTQPQTGLAGVAHGKAIIDKAVTVVIQTVTELVDGEHLFNTGTPDPIGTGALTILAQTNTLGAKWAGMTRTHQKTTVRTLIDLPVAIIVKTVTNLISGVLGATLHPPVVAHQHALALETTAKGIAGLVREHVRQAVAVIVHTITDLCTFRIDGALQIVTIPGHLTGVVADRATQTLGHRVRAIGVLVAVQVVQLTSNRPLFIRGVVTVIILAVAQLCRIGIDVTIGIVAVARLGRRKWGHGLAQALEGEVHTPAITILVHLVLLTTLSTRLIHLGVAVVILAIAGFLGKKVHFRITVVAIT